MSTSPNDFSGYIAAGLRASAERAAAAKQAQEEQQAKKRQAKAVALDALQNVVSPELDDAAAQLSQAGISAEVGNGRDSYGCLRRSLSLFPAHGGTAARLVFTVESNVPVPFLGVHREPVPPMRYGSVPVADTRRETIRRIIGELIQNHMP